MSFILVTWVNRGGPVDRSGGLLAVDEENGEVIADVWAPPPAWPDDWTLLMHGKRGMGGMAFLEGLLWVACFDSVLAYDARLRVVRHLSHPWYNGLHGIAPAADGGLWVTSTGLDSLLRIDLSGELLECHRLGEEAALAATPRHLDWDSDLRRRVYPETALHPNHVSELDGEVYVSLCHIGDLWALRARRRVLAPLGIGPWSKLHDGKVSRFEGRPVAVGNSSDTGVFHLVDLSGSSHVRHITFDTSTFSDQDPARPESRGRRGWLRGLHLEPDGRILLGQATAKLVSTRIGNTGAPKVIPLNRGPSSSVVEVLRLADSRFAEAFRGTQAARRLRPPTS